jgi:hypothetical protein
MDDTYKYGEGQSLELIHDQVNMNENCANKFVPKIRKKEKKKAATAFNVQWTDEKLRMEFA